MARTAELAFVVSVKSELDRLQKDLDRTYAKLGKVGGGFTNTKRVAASLERGLLVMGAAAVAGTAMADKMAMQYESSLQKIVGLVGISQKQVDAWGKQLLVLGPQLGKGPEELADALYYVTSAGISTGDAIGVLTASAKASTAGLGTTADIANVVTSALNAYGIKNLSASKATDILTAAVREGKMEASELAPVMGQVIPMAAALGLSFDQVAGSMAVMSRTGLDASEAAVSLNAMLTGLLKPSKEGAKALDAHGLSMAKLRDMLKKPDGLISVMRLLDKTFQGNDEELAKVIPNVRSMRGLLNVLSQDAATVDKVMAGVANSTGAAGVAFAAAADTDLYKYNQAISQVKASSIEFGNATLPIVTRAMEAAAGVLKNLSAEWEKLTPAEQDSRVQMGLWAAGIIYGTYAAGKAVVGISVLVKAYGELKVAVLGAKMFQAAGELSTVGSAAAASSGSLTAMGGAAAAVPLVPFVAMLVSAGVALYALHVALDDPAMQNFIDKTRNSITATQAARDAELIHAQALATESVVMGTSAAATRGSTDALHAYYAALGSARLELTEQQATEKVAIEDRIAQAQAQAAVNALINSGKTGTAEYALAQLQLTAANNGAKISGDHLVQTYSMMSIGQVNAAIKSGTLSAAQGKEASAIIAARNAADKGTTAVGGLNKVLGQVPKSKDVGVTVTVLGQNAVNNLINSLARVRSSTGSLQVLPNAAVGARLSGSSSGYLATLHGTEYVLPTNNPRRYMELRAQADREMGVTGGNGGGSITIAAGAVQIVMQPGSSARDVAREIDYSLSTFARRARTLSGLGGA